MEAVKAINSVKKLIYLTTNLLDSFHSYVKYTLIDGKLIKPVHTSMLGIKMDFLNVRDKNENKLII